MHYNIDEETYLEQLRQLEMLKSQLADEKSSSQQDSIDGEIISEQNILERGTPQSYKSVWLENKAYKQLQRELDYYIHNHS